MQQQKGFTLIELIIVIVILGILAVTAAPKFIDIQKDAKASTVKAVEGAIDSVSSIVYGKALIAGQTGASGKVTVNGDEYDLVHGYLAATQTTTTTLNLTSLLDVDTEMAAVFHKSTATAGLGAPGPGTASISFYGFDNTTFNYATPTAIPGCLILYTQATATGAASVTRYTGGCN
ncbi:prepilin-type N-terminal cleavage/methylation domain-containing protein [Paraglaciecola sp.]|uniref:prepilin-type N-terminal cleavage/methylation domain-containing protein n=1 Tax=Paraglaciecola sp. TaxID=1920173 RepID=UPI0030F41AC4